MLFLSIHPEFVTAIARRTKTVELRRQVPRCKSGEWIAIYAASPTMRLEGVAKVGELTVSTSQVVWNLCRESCGVSKSTFDEYFRGAKRAVGIPILSYQPLSAPIPLGELRRRWNGFSPPQGFRYLTPEQLAVAPEIARAIEVVRHKAA